MAGKKTLGALMTEIDVMLNGLNANAADLVHLAGRKTNLEGLRTQLVQYNQEQEAAQAQAQQATERLHAAMKSARKELKSLKNGVKAVYGENTQKIEEFGARVRS